MALAADGSIHSEISFFIGVQVGNGEDSSLRGDKIWTVDGTVLGDVMRGRFMIRYLFRAERG
jgi:hypothetical protein